MKFLTQAPINIFMSECPAAGLSPGARRGSFTEHNPGQHHHHHWHRLRSRPDDHDDQSGLRQL